MKTYRFTIKITKPTIIESVAAERLCVWCDDALFGVSNGKYTLDFDREASCLDEAIDSAISDIRFSGIGSDIIEEEKLFWDTNWTSETIKKKSLKSRVMDYFKITSKK